ncbi:hypothetical protein P1J78_24910, partial [Psychromarinibacter sp. C21-152]
EMERSLADLMPGFHWVIETLERLVTTERDIVEPVRLLDEAEIDRHQRGWDFVFVVTTREMRGRERQRLLGVTAGLFASALVSTAFLGDAAHEQRPLAPRLHALSMHLFGRLNGLAPEVTPTWMRRVERPDDLDATDGYAPSAVDALSLRMEEVADLRVEETQEAGKGWLGFYARSLWQNRGALPIVISRMRPWNFPLRLHRLTTAAGSALAVLVMTAESWEVAANLSASTITVLSVAAIVGTSGYLIRAQRLLASRQGPLREQRAVSNAGTVAAVLMGLAVTYAGIFTVASVFAAALFSNDLIATWTGVSDAAAVSVRVRLAALAACVSVVIGALGAAFEPYGYFRHVTQIDDEI